MSHTINDTHSSIATTTVVIAPLMYSTLGLTLDNDWLLYSNRHDVEFVFVRTIELVNLHHSNEGLTTAFITATLNESLNEWSTH